MRYKSGGRRVYRRDCRHCQVVDEFRAAQDAREALRESGQTAPPEFGPIAYYQLSDEEFDRAHPPLRLKDWLVEKAEEWRDPGR